MRLDDYDETDIRVGTTEGSRGGFGRGFGGGSGGKMGLGSLVIVAIAALVFGVDPAQMLGDFGSTQSGPETSQSATDQSVDGLCNDNAYAKETCNALASLNGTWKPILGANFRDPILRFPNSTNFDTGCGAGSTGMGPFYCPADESMYIDTGFYDQLAQMSGNRGDFARYYVVAHEYGHHIQHVTGSARAIREFQQRNPRAANQAQVMMELQADCYAGLWAGLNRNLIEPGDMEEGLKAASAIGDDTLQRNAGRTVSPEAFTHGTSAQRMQALRKGLESRDPNACQNDLSGA